MTGAPQGTFEPEFSCLVNQLALKGLFRFGRAGLFSDFNGCGWIATYNLFRLLGKNAQPEEVLHRMEPGTLFGGRLGVWPFAVSKCLKRDGLFARWHFVWPWSKKLKTYPLGAALVLNRRGLHYVAYRRLADGAYQFYNERQGDMRDVRPFADFLKQQRACVLMLEVAQRKAARQKI